MSVSTFSRAAASLWLLARRGMGFTSVYVATVKHTYFDQHLNFWICNTTGIQQNDIKKSLKNPDVLSLNVLKQ